MLKYFTLQEFTCNHCGELPPEGMSLILLEVLDNIREKLGKPITVTSGYRCPVHNSSPAVGGVPNSTHVRGLAADVTYENIDVDYLAEIAAECGAAGIGVYWSQDFVHIDVLDGGIRRWSELD